MERPEHTARNQLAAERPSLEESWAQYQVLLRQQDKVIHSVADAKAFRYGLERFTSRKDGSPSHPSPMAFGPLLCMRRR